MVYPTPGFVVRQTFLEFKEGEEQEAPRSAAPLRRVASDSALTDSRRERDSLYGSEDLRRYVEEGISRPETPEVRGQGFSLFSVPLPVEDSWCSREASSSSDSGLTTLFLQNLPPECKRHVICSLLDAEGFAGCYDFVYAPVDLLTMCGNGYGFVNFTRHEDAVRAFRRLDGFSRWPDCGWSVCEVSWSSFCQGLDAHIERYRNSPVMHEKVADICKPMLFHNGVPIAFPAPTKRLRVPRVRGKTSRRQRGPKGSGDEEEEA